MDLTGDGGVGDTIAAIATAAGVGGVGIVRLSGPAAIAIAADALGVAPAELDRRVRVGWARARDGAMVDQVLAFAMRAPASFTGEDVAELHGHGGPHNLARLLASVVERGARVAEPGEFTRRAVAGGKLDLLRAEALLEVIHAGSERAWRLAQANLGGRLGERVAGLERRALAVLAELEGAIDFPEQDLELASAGALEREVDELREACASLVDGFRHGHAVSRGITVALVGPVNAGKSSLLNALVGRERALVGEAPGTTRDWLEVDDVWSGVAVTLIDTAGLRDTGDAVEQRGIALGVARVESADVVLVISDGDTGGPASAGGRRSEPGSSPADAGGDRSRPGGPGAARRGGGGGESESLGVVGEPARVGVVGESERAGVVGESERVGVVGEPPGARTVTGASGASSARAASQDALARYGERAVRVRSKADLAAVWPTEGADADVVTSAATGQGLDDLRRRVLAVAGVADQEGSEQAFVTTARQRALAATARDAFAAALASHRGERPPEVVAIELREAAQALAQLRGVEVGERVLDEVFARFCIGK